MVKGACPLREATINHRSQLPFEALVFCWGEVNEQPKLKAHTQESLLYHTV